MSDYQAMWEDAMEEDKEFKAELDAMRELLLKCRKFIGPCIRHANIVNGFEGCEWCALVYDPLFFKLPPASGEGK